MKLRLSLLLALLFLPSVARGQVTATTANLRWTAVGDDSLVGRATSYDIRYSLSPITAANWPAATVVLQNITPAPVGTTENFLVTGLVPLTTYYFAIKTADEVPNWSGISNILQITTLAPPDVVRPAPITDLRNP